MDDKQPTLRIPSNLAQLEAVRDFVEQQAVAWDIVQDTTYDILLAVEEMVTNIIVHGYRGQAGEITITLRRAGDALEISLTDQAPLFDPMQVPAPDISLPLEQRPFGGMGIHLARHCIDAIHHGVTVQGGNELILTKHRVFGTHAKEARGAPDD
jgi:anti-sigma regulatory factor (Ser/Thr protein kinase)